MTLYGTPDENYFMYRVEEYLVHKYTPDLVDTLHITFRKARIKRTEAIKREDVVIHDKGALEAQIIRDLQELAPWKPPKSTHKATRARPGISAGYQQQFTDL